MTHTQNMHRCSVSPRPRLPIAKFEAPKLHAVTTPKIMNLPLDQKSCSNSKSWKPTAPPPHRPTAAGDPDASAGLLKTPNPRARQAQQPRHATPRHSTPRHGVARTWSDALQKRSGLQHRIAGGLPENKRIAVATPLHREALRVRVTAGGVEWGVRERGKEARCRRGRRVAPRAMPLPVRALAALRGVGGAAARAARASAPRGQVRCASTGSSEAVSHEPIAFSKTAAARISRDPMLGDHERNSSPVTVAVIVTVGILFTATLAYNFATSTVDLTEMITPEDLIKEQVEKLEKAKAALEAAGK